MAVKSHKPTSPGRRFQQASDFEEITRQPITREMLINVSKEAENALSSPIFGNVDSFVQDFGGNSLTVRNIISPPGGNKQELLLSKNGQNWINQAAKG